jgi:hypothetical protein
VHGRSETACPRSLERQTAELKLMAAIACQAFANLPKPPIFFIRLHDPRFVGRIDDLFHRCRPGSALAEFVRLASAHRSESSSRADGACS